MSQSTLSDRHSAPLKSALAGMQESIVLLPDRIGNANHLLNILVHHNGMRELIHDTLASKPLLDMVAKRSSIHENGFVKIPILKDDLLAVRIHIWDCTKADTWHGNIHDHRFSFWSHVLAGVLWQRKWQEANAGDNYSRYKYFVQPRPEQHVLQYDGEGRLLPETTQKLSTGTTYFFPAGKLHQTSVGAARTVTLLVEDRLFLRPQAIVYSRRYPQDAVNIEPQILSIPECEALLRQTLLLLN